MNPGIPKRVAREFILENSAIWCQECGRRVERSELLPETLEHLIPYLLKRMTAYVVACPTCEKRTLRRGF